MSDKNTQLNHIVEALRRYGKYDYFKSQFTNFNEATVEAKINRGVTILKAAGILESINESAPSENPRELQVTTTMLQSNLSEADARRVLDLPPIEVAQLGRRAVAEYTFARKCGISESDATVIAKLGGSQYRR
jgi:hypothetical protein